jgi:hypothetical protein
MRTRITTLSVGLLFAAAYAGPLPSPKIRLRDRVTGSLRAFDFSIDPADSAQPSLAGRQPLHHHSMGQPV